MLDTPEAVRTVTEDAVSAPWQALEVRKVCSACCSLSPGRCRWVRACFVLQVLVFPELAFRHEGYLAALEFVTQELQQPVQVRFQVHRPIVGEGEAPPASTRGIVRADAISQMECPWPLVARLSSEQQLCSFRRSDIWFKGTCKICRGVWAA